MKSIRKGLGSVADALIKSDITPLDLKREVKLASDDFNIRLISLVNELYTNHNEGADLTRRVADLAIREGLTGNEVDHLVRGINRKIFQKKYDETKGKDDRRVTFKIADPYEVKAIMGLTSEPKESVAEESDSSLEKVASEKKASTVADAIMSFDPNESAYVGSITPAICTDAHQEYVLDKIAMNLQNDMSRAEMLERSIKESVDLAGACFVKYASHGLDHQDIFKKMCVTSQVEPYVQEAIKGSFDYRKTLTKSAKDHSIELVKISEEEDFSLGKYSISKIAESTIATLPEVVNKKRQINNFQKLVDLAVQIQKDDEMLNQINENIETKKRILEESNIIDKKPEVQDELPGSN